jgi:hypothetical protein
LRVVVGQVGSRSTRHLRVPSGHEAATILRERNLPVPANLDTSHRNVLLRVFCHAHGEKIVLLLAAYDKGKEPSTKRQSMEIKRAKQRLAHWKGEQAMASAAGPNPENMRYIA